MSVASTRPAFNAVGPPATKRMSTSSPCFSKILASRVTKRIAWEPETELWITENFSSASAGATVTAPRRLRARARRRNLFLDLRALAVEEAVGAVRAKEGDALPPQLVSMAVESVPTPRARDPEDSCHRQALPPTSGAGLSRSRISGGM